jgi:hypothetical protein
MAKKVTKASKRPTITPQTRGAARTGPTVRPNTRPNFPFKIPGVKGNDDEAGLFSDPDTTPITGRTRKSKEAVEAAARRMRGPSAEEVDALGEGDYLEDTDTDPADDSDDGDDEGTDGAGDESDEEIDLEDLATDEERERMLRGTDVGAAMRAVAATPSPANTGAALRAEFEALVREEVERRMRTQSGSTNRVPDPELAPAPMPAAYLTAARVSHEDIDRLWDWIRRDPSSSQAFFGRIPNTSRQLHAIFEALADAEHTGVGLARALVVEGGAAPTHIGFAMIAPIMADDQLALLHVYLEPSMRGRLQQLIGPLVELASKELPNYRFGVYPANEAQRRLYGALLPSLGFTAHTLFVR